ncbi:Rho GTPase activation protein [Mortierella sp. GBAus27b]|nr:Rho GTPase activation protein [Mortierella sp. GBAus27b]
MVPAILYRCAEYLEAKGADEVGLYRVPGSHANVQKLKKMFDTGKDHNLLATEGLDPNDIATLLKLYLRELPTPLLPAVFVEQFQSVISTDRQVCHSLRGMLVRLPRPNYVVLSFLCHHLSKIASYAEKTKMNISNLGVVFAPTLSIGSVLFKALLGGYYDPVESLDSREKGLKIVWSGLVQDFDNPQDWSDDTMSQDGLSTPMLTPAQELVNATKGPSASASSTLRMKRPN